MSLLFPLYLGGLLAISLPVVFHMIRRTPSGRVPFSSLMFLRKSPPRLVRRKRLEQVALLCLRALVLALLALAFARPYLRDESRIEAAATEPDRVVLLVDTSASMRRTGLWEATLREARIALGEQRADAATTLLGFDEDVTEVDGLDALAPSWRRTDLGRALVEAAERLQAKRTEEGVVSTIVLISDLQQGSELGELEGYDWPADIRVDVRRVSGATSNAAIHAAPREPGQDADEVSVRLTNAGDSQVERFQLRWADDAGGLGEAQNVICPPGEMRVVRAPERPAAADRIVLTGDQDDFDNVLFERPVRSEALEVLSIGGTSAEDQDLDFFLASVFAGGRTTLSTTAVEPDAFSNPLVVLRSGAGEGPGTARLREYVEEGGNLLVVLGESFDEAEVRELLQAPELTIEERETAGFALLGEIDFEHPLFRPFADPRYSDFTKVRFWRRRGLALPEDAGLRVLARFEDSAPFLVERSLGAGRVFVMTSSWEPADGDLARSSKFAPLLQGLARLDSGLDPSARVFHVGDTVAAGSTVFGDTDEPGRYEHEADGRTWRFAVNLDPRESRTAPMELDPLLRAGAPLVADRTPEARDAREKRERQELGFELERRQQLWRWLLFAAVAGLLVETAWAGRLARRAEAEAA